MWVKATSLVEVEDEFEISTPTATMGVRGTQFFVGVDESGDSTITVGAGVVAVQTAGSDSSNGSDSNESEILVYPTQQANLYTNGSSAVAPIDLETFVQHAPQDIIEAMLRNKQAADKENEQFIQDQQQQLINEGVGNPNLDIKNQEDLERLQNNLDHMTANI